MIVQHYSPTGEQITYQQARRISTNSYAVLSANIGGGEVIQLMRASLVTTMEPARKFIIRKSETKRDAFGRLKTGVITNEYFERYSDAYAYFMRLYEEREASSPGTTSLTVNEELDRHSLTEEGRTFVARDLAPPQSEVYDESIAQMVQEADLYAMLNPEGYEAMF